MKRIIQLSTSDGGEILVETSDLGTGETVRGFSSDTRGIIENTKESFDKAIKPLKEISNSIINCVNDISLAPSEVQVELGLKFTAKAGIILTSLDGEAHFNITFKWVRDNSTKK